MLKATHSKNMSDSPFQDEYYDDLDFILYAGDQVSYGLKCLFWTGDDDDKFYNMGECSGSGIYLIIYSLSLFVIQLNLNSIMHYKFTKGAQKLYSIMVPLTLGAFLFAQVFTIIEPANLTTSAFDYIGFMMVAAGVFVHNIKKERPL